MPVPGRLPRVVPQDLAEPFVVDGQVIPPGVSFVPDAEMFIVLLKFCRPLSPCQPTQCIPTKRFGVPTLASSTPTVGFSREQSL